MKSPATFPLTPAQSGVYAAAPQLAELKRAAPAADVAWFELDLARVDTKAALIERCEQVLGLPPLFGRNWDALVDSVEDFSWRPAAGFVVNISNGAMLARSAPGDLATLLEIFANAATYWSAKDKIFAVLVDASTRGARVMNTLPA
ncbi:MAG: barnase inhibitor [Betaproteobacteria bacterium]|nr:barnase inhibitor [Betaproteobacteria bacterium]